MQSIKQVVNMHTLTSSMVACANVMSAAMVHGTMAPSEYARTCASTSVLAINCCTIQRPM